MLYKFRVLFRSYFAIFQVRGYTSHQLAYMRGLFFFDVCTISLDITKKCNPKFSLDRRGLGRVLYLTPVLPKWPHLSGAIPVSIFI